MNKTYDSVLVSVLQKDVLHIVINRPKALNALNKSVFEDLQTLFRFDIDYEKYRAIIISGAGEKAFAAGADIKEFMELDKDKAIALSQRGQDIFSSIEQCPIPVIAAVNGYALGGGCELAMACHLRVAGAHTQFGQPEAKLGILPGYGATQRLTQLVGKGRALELLLTSAMIDAEQALAWGLVNRVCESGKEIDAALALIDMIRPMAPLAIKANIESVIGGMIDTAAGYRMESQKFGLLAETKDFKEGVSAFLAKRKPTWKGE